MKQFILSILILTSTSLYAQCEGDLNGDGIKNILDIIELVNEVMSGDTECEEQSVHGCLDSQACNYDSGALIDNNSCIYCYDDDCNTYPEEFYDCNGGCLIDLDEDDVCDNIDNCIFYSSEGYYCNDLDIIENYLDGGYAYDWWENGRVKDLRFNGITSNGFYIDYIPEEICELEFLEFLYKDESQEASLNFQPSTMPTCIFELEFIHHISFPF